MKESKTLRMSFVDEGGNPWSLNILNPKDGLKRETAQSVADTITTNNLVNGKMGQVKTYNGATIITRNEQALWLWKICCLIFQTLAFPLPFLATSWWGWRKKWRS